MTTATGRVLGWDLRDEDNGASLEGLSEYVTGPLTVKTLPDPFGKPSQRYFIHGVDVEPGSVRVAKGAEDEARDERGRWTSGGGGGVSLSDVRASVTDDTKAKAFADAYRPLVARSLGLEPDQVRVNVNSAKWGHFAGNAKDESSAYARQYTVQYRMRDGERWQTVGMLSVKGNLEGYGAPKEQVAYQGKQQDALAEAYGRVLSLSEEDKAGLRGGGIQAAMQDPAVKSALDAWAVAGSRGTVSPEQMEVMTNAVRDYGTPSESALFRGIGMSSVEDARAAFSEGKTIDMAASSFSPNAGLAERYTGASWADGRVPVMVIAPQGTQALDVGSLYMGEPEQVVAGRFTVASVEPYTTTATSNMLSAPTERAGIVVRLQ